MLTPVASTATHTSLDSGVPVRRPQLVSSGTLGMMIFVVTEVMLFAGMISAFMIVRTTAVGAWPPPDQPRLPVGETLINTAALLVSGVFLFLAQRAYYRGDLVRFRVLLRTTMGLGAFFVLFQGAEWIALLYQGLTLTSSTHGSFFYMIVGTHAAHAIAALALLGRVYLHHARGTLASGSVGGAAVLWYFVVIMWPFLYARVYL
ncbi:MAG: cytochrome c oxidase subunit 3 [Nannocystaceae bacterium]